MDDHGRIRRVLMTADTVGGVWTYALDLARGLCAHGLQVALATMGAPLSPHQSNEAAQIAGLEVFESEYQLEWMNDPWRDVERAARWLLTLENDLAPDVVHLNGYAHGSLPWRAPRLVAAHSCVLSWWRAVKGEQAPEHLSRYRFAVTSGVRSADFVVAPTRAMLAEVQRFYGPIRSTAVIANGRSWDGYRPGTKEPFILAAGRVWDDAKNIAALSSVRRGIDWPICVAGDTRRPDGSPSQLDGVNLLGVLTQDQLANYYRRAAIYCLPARYEPFGLSILEAALSGCALVLGDIPSLRENWEGAAAFVPPGDASALERCLRGLIGNGERLRSLAFRARKRAGRFSLERMTASYLTLYSELSRPRVPRASGRWNRCAS